jgi:hypothetical protein
VRLAGGAALDVLQKLAYLVLPSQNAFSGVSSKSLDRAGNLHFRCGLRESAQRDAGGPGGWLLLQWMGLTPNNGAWMPWLLRQYDNASKARAVACTCMRLQAAQQL